MPQILVIYAVRVSFRKWAKFNYLLNQEGLEESGGRFLFSRTVMMIMMMRMMMMMIE